MRLFSDITLAVRPGHEAVSYVKDGLAVWEYVLVAKNYGFDVARTAEHLQESIGRVRAALDYYSQLPREVDERLSEMDRAADDPSAYGLTVLTF